MKVGDYVRTKKGMIAKIIDKKDVSGSLHNEAIVFILDNGNMLAINSMKVIKSSPDIIDLIEVGDYVNGYKIINKNKCTLYIDDYADEDSYLYINQENIKSIVTKERFESMEYKVGE